MRFDVNCRASVSEALVCFCRLQPRPVWPKEILQRIQLQRERNVTAIPEYRHLENPQKTKTWYVINPFWERVVVPHLPKKTAHQRANRERDHRAPIALRQLFQEIAPPRPVIDRFQNENQRNPGERVKDVGPS